jgi:hypothetical protein
MLSTYKVPAQIEQVLHGSMATDESLSLPH